MTKVVINRCYGGFGLSEAAFDRLLEAKGLRELAEAAALIRAEFPEVRFRLLGPAEKGPGAVPLDEVRSWEKQGLVEYLGETQDVRPYLAQASVVILPSWREGTPCSLMEAMSVGRAVIAANAPGSREVVRHGLNGFLTPVRDAEALANTAKHFIMDPSLAARMGAAGRALMEAEFSADLVADELMRSMGLERGVEGSKARHRTVKNFYASLDRIERLSIAELRKIEKPIRPPDLTLSTMLSKEKRDVAVKDWEKQETARTRKRTMCLMLQNRFPRSQPR